MSSRAVPKTILAPTDFSDASQAAVRHAAELAGALGASLHVVHVVSSDLGPGAPELWGVYSDDLLERLELKAKEQLEAIRLESEEAGLSPHVATRTGGEVVEIDRYAREHDVDLIVMGTHGRGGIEHLLLGSVAEKVVRSAPCPVMTIRPK